ncbi:ROK family transcriptional regulator [Scatolibacter rhodanostii]|uniref:ROK family transcriptional regulator n=1 Tax=Scatolibacter rhodanostii TaxID=2014781 RepID=UPI000C06C60E|nr:ROK family transcriptional regulator [Scatolibacter rhodanostii]
MLGQNNENLLQINRSLVVQNLQQNKVMTRAQLSKRLGLTPASITKIVGELIEKNLIEEIGFQVGEKGRRSIGIRLKNQYLLIGAKLSRRNFSVGVFNFNGEIMDYYTEKLAVQPLKPILEKIKEKIREYIDKYPKTAAIGLAVPGPYLEKESRIVLVTETEGWEQINLKEEFAEGFDRPVIIKHDANSGALAEWWFGKHSTLSGGTLVNFFVGEGIGAGVIVDGEIMSGDTGTAGEIGHVSINAEGLRCDCGNFGCLELYCSSLSLVKRTQKRLHQYPNSRLCKIDKLKAEDVFAAAESGDELAIRMVEESGKYMGYGLVTLMNVYDPSTIVISGEMARGGERILKEAVDVVKERVSPYFASKVKIQLSAFSKDPILYGAAAVAIDYCLKNPLYLEL